MTIPNNNEQEKVVTGGLPVSDLEKKKTTTH